MSKPKISDSINLPVGAAFAVIITFTVPELAGLAWILFVAAFIIKFLNL